MNLTNQYKLFIKLFNPPLEYLLNDVRRDHRKAWTITMLHVDEIINKHENRNPGFNFTLLLVFSVTPLK